MIKVSTDYSKNNRKKYLSEHNAYFSTVVMKDGIDEIDIRIIKKIDNATVNSNNTINGRFGITSLVNISTGAKTLINIRNILKKSNECYVDITSCGDNCIELLVDILKRYNDIYSINLLTCLDNYISTKEIDMFVDNKYSVKNFSEIGVVKDV